MLKTKHLLSRLLGSFSLFSAPRGAHTGRPIGQGVILEEGMLARRRGQRKLGWGSAAFGGGVEGQMWAYVVLAFDLVASASYAPRRVAEPP